MITPLEGVLIAIIIAVDGYLLWQLSKPTAHAVFDAHYPLNEEERIDAALDSYMGFEADGFPYNDRIMNELSDDMDGE